MIAIKPKCVSKNNLALYKAKSDGTTIKEHNDSLFNIMRQIFRIYAIDENMAYSLYKCIKYHDIGKCTDFFQNNIDGIYRNIRHEILSASVKKLSDEERIAIITHHKQISELIQCIENEFYEDEVEEMSKKLNIEVKDIRGFIKKISFPTDELNRNLNAILLKGYLQYCDHLASAGIKKIDKGFNSFEKFKFDKYTSIQNQILSLDKPQDVMIVGPTGVGKTSTSLYWSNLVQNYDKSKRIYYLLPYIASINAIYKDFVRRDISTSMIHSRLEYFLEKIDIENSKEMQNIYRKSVKQINISTIYQIVKVIFSCKRFEMLLGQLKDSIFVVDEIHCYNIEELSLILTTLKFLKEKLNVSICIMSASIPTCLQELVYKKLKISKNIKSSEEDFKVRHRIYRRNKTIPEDLDEIKKDLNSGKKVLICVNTVKLAQDLFQELVDYKPKLVHGRFNARDRELIESSLGDSKLLIGTQAIQVSLNISYDVMYTEIAPFDALQQRFGRVNRFGENGISDIYIYDSVNDSIYKNEQDIIYKDKGVLERTDIVISKIIQRHDGILLEDNMQEYLDEVYPEIDIDRYNQKSGEIEDIINLLKLGEYHNSDYLGTFNTISVLPVCLFEEYTKLMKEKKYIEAKSLLVNISAKLNVKYKVKNNVKIVNYIYDERGLTYEIDDRDYFL